MKINVQLFAAARERAGSGAVEVRLSENATVGALRSALVEQYPALADIAPHLHISIGDDYASDDMQLASSDRVACFPPVSGG